jgi:preprotein translocase subunit SecG
MAFLNTLLQVLQIVSALGVIGLVLLQHGKGADMGAAFGSGASGSVFGATGSANFLSRATAVSAAVFFLSTLAMAFFINSKPRTGSSVLANQPAITVPVDTVKPDVVAPASLPVKTNEVPKQ